MTCVQSLVGMGVSAYSLEKSKSYKSLITLTLKFFRNIWKMKLFKNIYCN